MLLLNKLSSTKGNRYFHKFKDMLLIFSMEISPCILDNFVGVVKNYAFADATKR